MASLHTSLVAHQARTYPGFHSLTQLGVFLLPPGRDASPLPVPILYTWVVRGTMRVKCLAQERNTLPWPGLEPGPFDPESRALREWPG